MNYLFLERVEHLPFDTHCDFCLHMGTCPLLPAAFFFQARDYSANEQLRAPLIR